MSTPSLLILAAGLGSRFGGLKQIAPLGPNGESIIDYSVYDAVLSGFKRIIFVIRQEHLADFQERFGYINKNGVTVDYAFQSINDLPQGFEVPEGRQKPWGTGHAVFAARKMIDGPFGVIGADDYYGRDTFEKLYKELSSFSAHGNLSMVGHRLKNTLPLTGTVKRGVCQVEDGFLKSVTERTSIYRKDDKIFYEENGVEWPICPDTMVSMIVWGLHSSIFGFMQEDFADFLGSSKGDPLTKEYFLPSFIDRVISTGRAKMTALESREKWYGVTNKEDAPFVSAALKSMHESGRYPVLRP